MTKEYEEYFDTNLVRSQIKMAVSYGEMALSTLKEFRDIFDCYDFTNYFKGVPSEDDIVDYATENKDIGSFLSSKFCVK